MKIFGLAVTPAVTRLGSAALAAVAVLAIPSAAVAIPIPPQIDHDGLTVDFGRAQIGKWVYGGYLCDFVSSPLLVCVGDAGIVFVNNGSSTAQDFTVSHSFSGERAGQFTIDENRGGCDHLTLAPGNYCNIDYAFTPTLTADSTALDDLEITYRWTESNIQRAAHLIDRVTLHGYGSLLCHRRLSTITGTPGNDILTGTPGDDIIHGAGGNDIINGGGGNDIICGGNGLDRLLGGPGIDQLIGGAGRDVCKGGPGQDIGRFCELRRSL